MDSKTIEQMICAGLPDAKVVVSGEDGVHFEALVVSPAFAGMSPIARQRLVMATVRPQIESGELHALSIKTLTPEQRSSQAG